VVTLAEDLYLLADDGATGRPVIDRTHLELGLGGALLLDLVMAGRVALVDGHVAIVDDAPTSEPLLDSAMAEVARQGRTRGPDHWVRHLAHGAHRAVRNRLLDAGILYRDDHRILRVIPMHRTPETDGRLHHQLVDHLHDAVVLGHPPTPETQALAALVLAIGLESHLFPRSDRRAVRRRTTEVAAGCGPAEWVANAVRQAVGGVDAALGIVPEASP
jgi:hypothetical protein